MASALPTELCRLATNGIDVVCHHDDREVLSTLAVLLQPDSAGYEGAIELIKSRSWVVYIVEATAPLQSCPPCRVSKALAVSILNNATVFSLYAHDMIDSFACGPTPRLDSNGQPRGFVYGDLFFRRDSTSTPSAYTAEWRLLSPWVKYTIPIMRTTMQIERDYAVGAPGIIVKILDQQGFTNENFGIICRVMQPDDLATSRWDQDEQHAVVRAAARMLFGKPIMDGIGAGSWDGNDQDSGTRDGEDLADLEAAEAAESSETGEEGLDDEERGVARALAVMMRNIR